MLDRRDHREPVLLAHRSAALALHAVPARAARAPTTCARSLQRALTDETRGLGDEHLDDRRRRARRTSPTAPRATPATRSRRSRSRPRSRPRRAATSITLADTRGRARAARAPLRRRRALRRALGVHQEHPRLRRRRRPLLARAHARSGRGRPLHRAPARDPRVGGRRHGRPARRSLVADAAARAVEFVGLPEAQLNLAHAVIYLATAPKSNSVDDRARRGACTTCATSPAGAVPAHLRDAHYPGAAKLGHGEGYVYPHDEPDGWVRAAVPPRRPRRAVLEAHRARRRRRPKGVETGGEPE